jgi:hypothetical protein
LDKRAGTSRNASAQQQPLIIKAFEMTFSKLGFLTGALLAAQFVFAQGVVQGQKNPAYTAVQQALASEQNPDVVFDKLLELREKNDFQGQTAALQRMLELRPYESELQYELARTYALAGERTGAFDTLIKLQQQGFAYSIETEADLKSIADTKVFKYIKEGLDVNRRPFGGGKTMLTVQSDIEQIESLAYDEPRKRFLVASMQTGDVLAVAANGVTTAFAKPTPENGLFAVSALAIDAPRNILYVASTALPGFKGFDPTLQGLGNISQFELTSGKFIKKTAIPYDGQYHVFVSLSVANSGELYAADVATNSVFQMRQGKLSKLFSSPEFVSIRSIAVSANHKTLFISDYSKGLFAANLEKNEIRELKGKNHNLGGIDGIYAYFDQLIAIQNRTNPKRIMRISVNPDGSIGMRPLEANKADLVMPTTGALVNHKLYFIANSQRDNYDASGKILNAKPARRKIYVVDPNFGADKKVPLSPGLQKK